jgi:OOP family OmpA-OmpF porin
MKVRHWLFTLRLITAISVTGLVAALPAAAYERTPALYMALGAGANIMSDADIDGGAIGTKADYDTGLAGAIALGFKRSDGFRSEFEIAGRSNDVGSLQGMSGASGDVDAFTAMGNILYDFQGFGKIKPYLGGGIGLARVRFDGVRPVGGGQINDHDLAFAYQGIAGLSYAINNTFEVFGDYRYLGTSDLDFQEAVSGSTVSADYGNHTLMGGIRIALYSPAQPMAKPASAPEPVRVAAPALPPAPEPDPEPVVRNFIVFFDWDKSDLTATAAQIVDAASQEIERVKLHIRLTGHADRSGADGYNMGLSKNRAKTVREELIRLGVNGDDIAIAWKGERGLLVPTPDNIREPQNRRVEIVFE